MKRFYIFAYSVGVGLLLMLLAGCSPALPEESSQVNPTWEPPIEHPVTRTPRPTSTLTPCGYFPTPDPPLPTVPPALKSQVTLPPLPDQGVRVEGVEEVFISEVISAAAGPQEFCLERLALSDLAGDIIVGRATVPGGFAIITMNVETGMVRQIGRVIEQGFELPQIFRRYVAWPEPAPDIESDHRLQLFDLEQNKLTTLQEGFFRYLDFKDNLLVWQAHANQSWNIYGYDLESGQTFTVVESPSFQSFPRICSDEWVIYLQNESNTRRVVDLYARHVPTNETVLIGRMPAPTDARFGEFHDCDGRYVGWINGNMEKATLPVYDAATGQRHIQADEFYHVHHLYDLGTRIDRVLNISPGLSTIRVEGGILPGYDIQRDAYFYTIPPDVPLEHRIGGGPFLLSPHRVVWIARPDYKPSRLFTALIIRD